jgi:uncharacterized coiled-coil DUF342 family protein
MALKDYPEIHAAFNKLMALKQAIVDEAAPLRAERDDLLAQMAPLQAQERVLIEQYKAIEAPLSDIDAQLSAMARATGGKALSD